MIRGMSNNTSIKWILRTFRAGREREVEVRKCLTIGQFLDILLESDSHSSLNTSIIIMGKLTQVTLQSILTTMMQDENFVESLADCIKKIFHIFSPNLETNDPFEIVIDRIMKYFEIHTEIKKVEIPGIRSTLIRMLKEKQFLAFARIFRMLQDSFNYPDIRIINYLKQLKFRTVIDGESISPWIDVQSTAEAVVEALDPTKMRIFAELSREERCLLQGFTPDQIAVMSKFSPKGIVVLSKLGHLPPNQRSMILGLNQDESKLFQDLGFDKIRSLSKARIFGFEQGQNTIRRLIDREAGVIQSMNEEAGTLAEGIHDLTLEEKENYLNLSPREVNIMNNLNDDHREVVLRFGNLNEVLNVAKNLHLSQIQTVLSLRQEEIRIFLANVNRGDFHRIQLITYHSPMIFQRSYPLSIEEQDAILELTQRQRLVLAEAYVLGYDGLFMILQLGRELTEQVLSGQKDSNVMQTALMKKLKNLNFDKNIISELFEIMEHQSQAILLNLSWRGIRALRKTADLNEGMIDVVRRLSNNGLEVLIDNDQLTGAEISILGNLDTELGNILMNLSVKQRYYLSGLTDLSNLSPSELFTPNQRRRFTTLNDQAESVLTRIVRLSDEEHRLLKGLQNLDTSFLTNLLPIELNLLASLTPLRLELLSSFTLRRPGENMISTLFKIPIGASYQEKIWQTEQILGIITGTGLQMNEHHYIPLFAGAIEVLRLNGVVNNNYVNEIITLLEGPTHPITLSLVFKVNLLKFSMRDATSLVSQLSSQIEGSQEDIMLSSWFNQIRNIEDVMFVRWILSSSTTMNEKGLFQVGRGSLIRLAHELGDGRILGAVLSKSTSQLDGIEHKTLMENLKQMLSADEHLLSSSLFFAIGKPSSSDEGAVQVTKLFIENFDADECFQLLNTPANVGFLGAMRDGDLPAILSDERFPNPTILEVGLYYNRGNILPLAEKLDEGQLWKLVASRPLLLLRIMTRSLQIDLIKLFGRVSEVKRVWESDRMEILRTSLQELTRHAPDLTSEVYLHIARGIRKLIYWPTFLGTDGYVTIISEYTKFVQGRVSRGTLRDALDSFASRDVSREYLIEAIQQRLGDELIIPLRDGARPSCNLMRHKRGATVLCVDSANRRDLTSEAERRIQESTINDEPSVLYDRLLEYSQLRFRSEGTDPRVQENLISRLKDIPMDALDPRIGDIAATLDDPQKFDTIIRQSGTLKKIEQVASATGLAFTLLLVGKHVIDRDIENIGYDALNLWIMPKIGEKITELLEKSHPVVGPVIGATVANFAAFLGLIDGIKKLENAKDEIDKELADLTIVTNTVFIVANIPAVATRIIAGFGLEAAVIGEFSGPVGSALSVSVIVGSYLIGAGLEMERVTEHLKLSFGEKLSLYWELLRGHPVPEQLKIDVTAKNMYTEYIAGHLRRLNETYDRIALSLPKFLITGRDKNTSVEMDFGPSVNARYPFSTSRQPSKLFPENLEGYGFVCGPSARDAAEKIVGSETKELFIPPVPSDDCQNIVSWRKHGSLNSSKTFLYVASDASIEFSDNNTLVVVFHGKNLIIKDRSSNSSTSAYHIQNQLQNCSIHKKGENLFHVVGETFECDLKDETEGQLNTVVVKNNFRDSRGIHSIVGSKKREKIESRFANFVDGNGGGDWIRATERTIVKGHLNDFVTGNCSVILPFNVNEIAEVRAHMRITIFNREGSWFGVDGNARMMTADYYILTPIRTLNDTAQRVIRAHLRKSFNQRISIEDELPVLRNLTIPNCKLVKQITSANYDIVLSDVGKNVFHMDKNNHQYYWEAPKQPGNLYIFRKMFGTVMIAHANGILDLKELGIDPDSNPIRTNSSPAGLYEMIIGNLHVTLLPNYGNVKITYDGKKYFTLGQSGISRDWCSHTIPIAGRVHIDANDLHNHYNCFEFQSDKIFFLRLRNDLVLVSGKEVLTIDKYYFHANEEIELSVKLKGGKIIEAPGFERRAIQAHKFIYYEVEDSQLVIYHNQPVDEHHIGYLDLEQQSVKDVEMMVDSGRLILLYRNSTLVRIENWDHYEPARYMVFAFNDSFLPNTGCILSDCDPNDIIEEWKIEKRKRSVASGASRGSSWINVIINPIRNYYATLFLPEAGPSRAHIKFSTDSCVTSNVNLLFVLLQNFLDRLSPPPKLPTIDVVETLSNIINLTEEYQGNRDPFQLYSDIVELVRSQRYHAIQEIFTNDLLS